MSDEKRDSMDTPAPLTPVGVPFTPLVDDEAMAEIPLPARSGSIFDRAERVLTALVSEPRPKRPTHEEQSAVRDLDKLRKLLDAMGGILKPMRVELGDTFGARVIFVGLVDGYAENVPGIASKSLEPNTKHRDVATAPYVLSEIATSAARHTPIAPITEPLVLDKCRARALAALKALFQLETLLGWSHCGPLPARPELAPQRLLCERAHRFAQHECGLDPRTASDVIAQAVGGARDFRFPELQAIGEQVAGELAAWTGATAKAIEAKVRAEHLTAVQAQERANAEQLARLAPASTVKTPRTLGAIVLTRAVGEREASMGTLPHHLPATSSLRDGILCRGFAFPVFPALGGLPKGAIVEEQTGPETFCVWNVAPFDEPIGLSPFDLDRITRLLAPRDIIDQVRRRLRTLPNASAPIPRERLVTAKSLLLAEARKWQARRFIADHAAAYRLFDDTGFAYLGALHQALVRGMLIDTAIVADLLAKTARKMNGATKNVREWAAQFHERMDDGERLLLGGDGCFVAPGSLLKDGGA